MFGIDSTELAVIALVALLVIGPKDLPRVMRYVGNWLAKGRAMSRHVRSGFDTMMREAEMEEMQKAWAAQNEAIMKATALPDLTPQLGLDDLLAQSWTEPTPTALPEEPPAPKKRARAATLPADDAAPKRKRTPRPKPVDVAR